MSFSRDDAILAVDGAIAHLMTVRRVLQGVDDDVVESMLAPWERVCPDSEDGSAHVPLWEREAEPALGPDGERVMVVNGMCRRCGEEFSRVSREGQDPTGP